MPSDTPVLCVRRSYLDAALALPERGFLPAPLGWDAPDDTAAIRTVPRSECEDDPRWKQVCSYAVLRLGGGVLRYRRSKQSGEGRLHGLFSIGIGGHVEDDDVRRPYGCNIRLGWASALHACRTAAVREVREETGLVLYPIELHLLGLVNDDTNPVGRVHLGVVYEAKVPVLPAPDHYGPELADPAFGDPFRVPLDQYESWSRIALDAGIIAQPTTAGR